MITDHFQLSFCLLAVLVHRLHAEVNFFCYTPRLTLHNCEISLLFLFVCSFMFSIIETYTTQELKVIVLGTLNTCIIWNNNINIIINRKRCFCVFTANTSNILSFKIKRFSKLSTRNIIQVIKSELVLKLFLFCFSANLSLIVLIKLFL